MSNFDKWNAGHMGRRMLTAAQTRARYGNISDMTLWRWLNNSDLGFPRPIIINRRRFFNEEELNEFDRTRERAAEREAA